MARIRGQKRKMTTPENFDLNKAPLPSPTPSPNPSSAVADWWENFSTRFSGYTPASLFKVSRKTFEYIRGLVEEEMMAGKNYTDLGREYLVLNDRLAIALTRLSTGEPFEAIANLFRVSQPTAYQIAWRFVEAIEKIGSHHLHWPKTEDRILEIKSRFEEISGLPNCCGAIDTTKIMFTLASDHAQRRIWCDQENSPCMILQAVVDPDMRFLDIIAGLPGCLSEPDALYEWSLFNLCEEGKMLNGKKIKLAETNEEIGEYIVGNGGFPLLPWLLTPYNEEKKLSDVQQDFNERHYATWKVAKMAFERLKETWQIIQGVLWAPDKLKLPRIIYACCVLHNIMIDQNDGFIIQDQSFLPSDLNSSQVHQRKCKVQDNTAAVQRDNLALYLSSKPLPFSGNGFETVTRLVAWTGFQPPADTTAVDRGEAFASEEGESAALAVNDHSIPAEVEATHAKNASDNKGNELADLVVEEAGARAKRARSGDAFVEGGRGDEPVPPDFEHNDSLTKTPVPREDYNPTVLPYDTKLVEALAVGGVDISAEMARFNKWLAWKFSAYIVQMETDSEMAPEDEWVFKVLNCEHLSAYIDFIKLVEAFVVRITALKKGKAFEDNAVDNDVCTS